MALIQKNFLPLKIHIKEQPSGFHRFEVNWTPTLVIFDPEGRERYRFSGYLPPGDFLAQVELGLGHAAFAHKNWAKAEQHYHAVAESATDEAAAEARYWAAASNFQRSHNPADLQRAGEELRRRYPASTWTKRSSPWSAEKKPERKTA